ncbi:MAG: ATP-binding protein [Bacteroidota bacterium]
MITQADKYDDFDNLIQKAEQLVDRRSPDALPLAQQIMQLATESNDPHQVIKAKYVMAFYSCLVANDYDKSIALCREILNTTDTATLNGTAYKLYMTLGNSYHMQGEVFSAQQAYMSGLKELEGKPETELEEREKGFLASFYYNVALLLSTSELNIGTEEYLENAIRIYKEMGNKFKLSKSYAAYASVLENKNENTKAIELMYKALELDTSLNDDYSLALTKANLGILHLRIQETEKAFGYLHDASHYYQTNEMIYESAMVKVSMSEVLFAIGKRQEGIGGLLEAEQMFAKLDNKRELTNIYKLISEFLEKEGNYKDALDYNRKYTTLLKDVFDETKTKALARAKSEFETEQKEKEAAILRAKNEEINLYADKLQQSNNQLNQFAHVASHDLREPLRMITSYITILQQSLGGSLSPQQQQFMDFAVDGAKRMEQLILDLLRLAKVDANPKIEKVNLNKVTDDIKQNLEVLIKEKKATITHSELPELLVDKTMFSQLFQNIIGNGMKYNESGQPSIHVQHQLRGSHFEITITDNGIGIPKEHREKAFQIFKRLPTVKKYSGTGIGLAICKKIVESFNGKISIEDNPTGGSIFRMEFPVSVLGVAEAA